MEQCIYCQGIYKLDESDATIPSSLCSKECEKLLDEYEKELEEFFYPSKNSR